MTASSALPSKLLFISTFPPTKCGIASFTQDLINAITGEGDCSWAIRVCALDKTANKDKYAHPVSSVMDSHRLESYIENADLINHDPSIMLVFIEHEFGLFSGDLGDSLLGFLSLINKPVVVRFHTVLPATNAKMTRVVQAIASQVKKVVVMTAHAAGLLQKDYLVPAKKIAVIPHGTHDACTASAVEMKSKYKLDNRLVLTTFGLLSPNKGIEKGILAMREVVKVLPQAIYVVIGQTHPNLIAWEGEKYRDYLQQLISDNNLDRNVQLLNEYVPTPMLMEYLALTDIYMFTSKDPNQAVSGTFLYAMSAGCAVITNSFVMAREVIDGSNGIILETDGEEELAAKAIMLLQDDRLRSQMRNNAFLSTRETAFKKVARKHFFLFDEIGSMSAAERTFSDLIIS